MTDKTYNALKWVAMVALPALATFILAICGLWGLPYSEQIAGTVTALATFLGALLQITSKNYKGDGTLNIDKSDPEKDMYSLDLTTGLSDIDGKNKITLKVNNK